MSMQEDYKKALYNKQFPERIRQDIDKQKCSMCGKKADYTIYPHTDGFDLQFFNISFKGINIISCERCYKIKVFLDDFTFRIMYFIFNLKIRL